MASLAARLANSQADRLTTQAKAQKIVTPFAARLLGPGSSSPNNLSNWRANRNGHRRSSSNGNATRLCKGLIGA